MSNTNSSDPNITAFGDPESSPAAEASVELLAALIETDVSRLNLPENHLDSARMLGEALNTLFRTITR